MTTNNTSSNNKGLLSSAKSAIQNIKQYIALVGVTILSVACSDTPNNITMTPSQGVCVQASQYSTTNGAQANAIATYPIIESNPTFTTPYCMAVTLQNNNSGTNANTVQITTGGLTLNYTVGSTTYSAQMYDPAAATITISGGTQTAGNVAIFDPQNCVTTQGANVQNLATGGGKCTFYLQLTGEGNPVGTYPTSLIYNYTNGNQNYSISTNINQRVYLYGGANNGLYFVNNSAISASQGSTGTPAAWSTGITGAPQTAVSYIIETLYGFVFFSSGTQVYLFNGISATQVGGNLPATVTSIAFDSSYNVYASTTNGIYVYNTNSTTTSGWTLMTDSSNQVTSNTAIIGLKGYEFAGQQSLNQLYAISSNFAYICTNLNPSAATFNCTKASSGAAPSTLYANAIDIDSSGNLYAGGLFGSALTIGVLSNFAWSAPNYTVTPSIPLVTGAIPAIGGVRWESAAATGSNPIVYFSVLNPESALAAQTESAVYTCNPGIPSCSPLLSPGGSNPIFGNANTITDDGLGNVYVAGSQLNSSDWGSAASNVTGAFLLLNPSSTAAGGVSSWTPITAGSLNTAPINFTAVASMLTTY